MTRDAFLAPLALLALVASPATAQRSFDDVEIKTQHVAGNIYMLEGSGGNIGVSAGKDGFLIVDDEFAPLAPKIKAALAAIAPGELEFVLNTHFHGDHTGGNEVFGLEATIIAQANVRERLSTPQTRNGQTTPPAPAQALPIITFDKDLTMYFNGERISAVYAPAGHTDTDSIIYFEGSNVLHMGDHFFAGRFPFVDIDSGGTVEGMADNVEKVLARVPEDVKIIPGHGPLSDKTGLRLFDRMLRESIDTVRAGLRAGKSLEQIEAEGLSEEWKDWSAGSITAERWIETVHRSLTL